MVTRIGIVAVPIVGVEAAEMAGLWSGVIVMPIAGAGVVAVPVAGAGVVRVPSARVAALTALPMHSVVLLKCILDYVRLKVSL